MISVVRYSLYGLVVLGLLQQQFAVSGWSSEMVREKIRQSAIKYGRKSNSVVVLGNGKLLVNGTTEIDMPKLKT